MNKLSEVFREEFFAVQPRIILLKLFTFFLPKYVASRYRTTIFRFVGFHIGKGSLLSDIPTMSGGKEYQNRLILGENVWININCTFDMGEKIIIGDRVDIGHEVLIITTTHKIMDSFKRAGKAITKPVTIQNGVWLGSRSTILPGITIGEGAIVAAGSVVTKDVAPNTIVGGVPATIIRDLSPEDKLHTEQPPPSHR